MGKGHHPEGESSDAGKPFPGGQWVVHVQTGHGEGAGVASARVVSAVRAQALTGPGCREPASKAGSRGRAGAWTFFFGAWGA